MRIYITVLLVATGLPLNGLAQAVDPYERVFFGTSWRDSDQDCLSTRQEILQQLSTARPVFNETGCRIVGGKWRDLFSDQVFTDSSDLDMDHIVPLKWAWTHGADKWTPDQRQQFANDLRFILPVDKSLNRSKGARSPLDWMPPNKAYRCQYVVKFYRGILVYDLALTGAERAAFTKLRKEVCPSID